MNRILLFLALASSAFAQITSSPSGGVGTGLPSQGGNTGKFLTTDGTTASWAAGGTVDWVTAHATTANAMGALVINTAKTLNTKTISADSVLTFSGTPAADTWFSVLLTEGGGANRTVTIPPSISVNRGGVITSFTHVASSKALLTWYYDGTNYILYGDPVLISDLTEDTSPDANLDFVETYDASAGLHKKVKPKNLRTQEAFCIAASDETTAITTGTAKATFRIPYAFTVTAVRMGLTTVSSSGLPTIDINESGTTILSTKLTCDASEKTSQTAATPAVISDTSLADDAEITIDFDVAGTGATGVKVWIIGYRQ